MPRLARVVMPGVPHHVTQRGNRRCDVFIDLEDRQVYLGLLQHYFEEHGVGTFSYCLMTNHTHLIVLPELGDSLARGLHSAHGKFAAYFNDKYGLRGHLWQSRFFSCPLAPSHFWNALRYVERNPVRAGLVSRAEAYPWSSAAAHCQHRPDSWLAALPQPVMVENWSAWLAIEEAESDLDQLRKSTRTGRPCGSDEFVGELEERLGRTLRPRKPGPSRGKAREFRGQAP